MSDILFRGKRLDNGEWKEGYVFDDGLLESKRKFIGCIIIEDDPDQIHGTDYYEVDTNTVSQYIGLTDKNGKKIFENYLVKLFGQIGVVCKCQGAFGIGFKKSIDYEPIDHLIEKTLGNNPSFVYNDNFISFWELMWNFECEENMCDVVEVIGDKWDNNTNKGV